MKKESELTWKDKFRKILLITLSTLTIIGWALCVSVSMIITVVAYMDSSGDFVNVFGLFVF